MKICTKCGESKPTSEYWRQPQGAAGLTASCKSCIRSAAAKWRTANPEKQKLNTEKKRLASLAEPREVKFERRLKHEYGINYAQWQKMFNLQNGCCAICSRHQSNLSRVLQVDHNHTTGVVRGLLCTKCNTKLAVVEDPGFIDKARFYLCNSEVKLVENE